MRDIKGCFENDPVIHSSIPSSAKMYWVPSRCQALVWAYSRHCPLLTQQPLHSSLPRELWFVEIQEIFWFQSKQVANSRGINHHWSELVKISCSWTLVFLRADHVTQFWLVACKGIQLILITHGFFTRKSADSLTFIYNSKSTPAAFLQSFVDMCREGKLLSHPMHMFPAEVKQRDTLSCFSSRTVNKYPLYGLSSATLLLFSSVFIGVFAILNGQLA